MQLAQKKGFEDKELQIFINSGGKINNFKYDNNMLIIPNKLNPN